MPLDVHGSRLVSGVLSNGVYGSRRKLAGVKRLSPLLLLAVLRGPGASLGGVLALVAAGVAILAGFAAWERRAADPVGTATRRLSSAW